MAKKLMKGSEAIAEAAVLAGCRYFFGYPITNIMLEKRGIDLDEILNKFFDGVGILFGMAHVNGSQAGNCVQGAFMMFLFAAVCGVIAWLFVRRSGVKPAPIRGE